MAAPDNSAPTQVTVAEFVDAFKAVSGSTHLGGAIITALQNGIQIHDVQIRNTWRAAAVQIAGHIAQTPSYDWDDTRKALSIFGELLQQDAPRYAGTANDAADGVFHNDTADWILHHFAAQTHAKIVIAGANSDDTTLTTQANRAWQTLIQNIKQPLNTPVGQGRAEGAYKAIARVAEECPEHRGAAWVLGIDAVNRGNADGAALLTTCVQAGFKVEDGYNIALNLITSNTNPDLIPTAAKIIIAALQQQPDLITEAATDQLLECALTPNVDKRANESVGKILSTIIIQDYTTDAETNQVPAAQRMMQHILPKIAKEYHYPAFKHLLDAVAMVVDADPAQATPETLEAVRQSPAYQSYDSSMLLPIWTNLMTANSELALPILADVQKLTFYSKNLDDLGELIVNSLQQAHAANTPDTAKIDDIALAITDQKMLQRPEVAQREGITCLNNIYDSLSENERRAAAITPKIIALLDKTNWANERLAEEAGSLKSRLTGEKPPTPELPIETLSRLHAAVKANGLQLKPPTVE
jgi:hypothetical protein